MAAARGGTGAAASSAANGSASAGVAVLNGAEVVPGWQSMTNSRLASLGLTTMLPLTGTTLSSTPTGRLGSVPGPACANVTGPLAATVQVVSGIGIVTSIGVPET